MNDKHLFSSIILCKYIFYGRFSYFLMLIPRTQQSVIFISEGTHKQKSGMHEKVWTEASWLETVTEVHKIRRKKGPTTAPTTPCSKTLGHCTQGLAGKGTKVSRVQAIQCHSQILSSPNISCSFPHNLLPCI